MEQFVTRFVSSLSFSFLSCPRMRMRVLILISRVHRKKREKQIAIIIWRIDCDIIRNNSVKKKKKKRKKTRKGIRNFFFSFWSRKSNKVNKSTWKKMKRGVLVIFLYCSFSFFLRYHPDLSWIWFSFFLSLFTISITFLVAVSRSFVRSIDEKHRGNSFGSYFNAKIDKHTIYAWRKRGKRWKDVPAKLILITSFTMGDKKPSAILPLSS